MLWSFSYFFVFFYTLFIFSAILYILPISKEVINYHKYKTSTSFDYVTGFDLHWILFTPVLLFLILNFSWTGPSLSTWFGHIIFYSFQYKMTFFVIFMFYAVISVYSSSFYFSSREIYDYIIVSFNFFLWIVFFFYANTTFTVIFFIEILSTLVFLLLITSTFSTTYFYNHLNLNLNNYFNPTTPVFYLQMLMYFFWTSLISSLNLFFFLILFYLKFLSFDWFLFEFVFHYIVLCSDLKDLFYVVIVWLNFLFCVFLKCGLVPFYFWKPAFFKGIPLHALFFYITFFYFFIFLFFIYYFLVYSNEIFFFFIYVNIFLLIIGLVILLFILCEAYYIKAFLALSSILNTLFVFLALSGTHFTDCILFL